MTALLRPDQLRRASDLSAFTFESTAELRADPHIIGQPRGIRAIDFGIGIESPGYNIYVLGESGTGRTTAIQRFIEGQAADKAPPDDWVYVHNFREAHKPHALRLPAGRGCPFRDEMEAMISRLQTEIPGAFENQAYRDAALDIQQAHGRRREQLIAKLQEKAVQMGATLISSPEGVRIVPARNGKPISAQDFAGLPEAEQAALKEVLQELEHDLNETLHQARQRDRELDEEMSQLVRRVGQAVVDLALDELKAKFADCEAIVQYLDAVRKDILENIEIFRGEAEEDGQEGMYRRLRLRRYRVNVVVDHLQSKHAPVVVEYNPSVSRLMGRVGHETYPGGAVLTDFSLIRGGALHAANGGYLVLRARDLFTEPGAWDALKRAMIGGKIAPDDPATRRGAATNTLDPEQIPVNLKLLLIGPPELYYALYEDEDFRAIFKVMSDFALEMDRIPENEQEYASFVARLCQKEELRHFDRGAVGMIVEYGGRLAGSQKKLSTRFGHLADVIREASYWSGQNGRELVSEEDVQRAIDERLYLRNRGEQLFREQISEGKKLLATQGEVVGQINGLSVSKIGEHIFGQAFRITASTFVGKTGVVQIDREVAIAGPIHNKGVLTLAGFLGDKYASDQPLSFTAMLTFEQSYGGIEGDSASSTELYALISSLSGFPIRQAIAVTGSVNQRGQVQPIGGVTQKVEGWYEICKERGFSGEQGVMVPATNVSDLMLRKEVLRAVEAGNFSIWAVSTIDEGLEILMGQDPETIHAAARKRLARLAEIGKSFEANQD